LLTAAGVPAVVVVAQSRCSIRDLIGVKDARLAVRGGSGTMR
jgi:hypothetical protein